MNTVSDIDYDLLQKLYNIQFFEGYSDKEIEELSEGYENIPSSLIGFWKKCGNTKKLFSCSQDPWVNLEYRRKYDWVKNESRDYYYLLNENQGVYQAVIRRVDMSLENPPVYIVEEQSDGTIHEIGQAESSITAFLMGMLIYEAGLSSFEYSAEDFVWYEEEDLEKIEEFLIQYPYHIYNWYSDRIDLYTCSGEEILFIMQGDTPNGTYSAKTEEAYKVIHNLIGNLGER